MFHYWRCYSETKPRKENAPMADKRAENSVFVLGRSLSMIVLNGELYEEPALDAMFKANFLQQECQSRACPLQILRRGDLPDLSEIRDDSVVIVAGVASAEWLGQVLRALAGKCFRIVSPQDGTYLSDGDEAYDHCCRLFKAHRLTVFSLLHAYTVEPYDTPHRHVLGGPFMEMMSTDARLSVLRVAPRVYQCDSADLLGLQTLHDEEHARQTMAVALAELKRRFGKPPARCHKTVWRNLLLKPLQALVKIATAGQKTLRQPWKERGRRKRQR